MREIICTECHQTEERNSIAHSDPEADGSHEFVESRYTEYAEYASESVVCTDCSSRSTLVVLTKGAIEAHDATHR